MNLLQGSLVGGAAFRNVEEWLKELSLEQASQTFPPLPYTIAGLLEHLKVTMRVSLDLVAGQIEKWPDNLEVWPAAPVTEAELTALLADLRLMLAEASALAEDPASHSRDILLDLAVHNAYHWGQVALLRRWQGFVPASHLS